MPPTATSRAAYYRQVVSGRATTQREILFDALWRSPCPLNRRQLSKLTGISINAVCGRINALIEAGHVVIDQVEQDPQTRRRTEYLRTAAGAPEQLALGL